MPAGSRRNWAAKNTKIDRTTGERVKRGNHAAMPYADVPAFMAKLSETPGVAAKALMFTILTCARTSEVLNATFDEVSICRQWSGAFRQSG